MFTEKMQLIIYNGGATKGGKYLISKGIGTVIWYQNEDVGEIITNKFNNVLYFTDSPVNKLSETELDESMKDDEGTQVLAKM